MKAFIRVRSSKSRKDELALLGDNLVTADIVNNIRSVCQTNHSIVNNNGDLVITAKNVIFCNWFSFFFIPLTRLKHLFFIVSFMTTCEILSLSLILRYQYTFCYCRLHQFPSFKFCLSTLI